MNLGHGAPVLLSWLSLLFITKGQKRFVFSVCVVWAVLCWVLAICPSLPAPPSPPCPLPLWLAPPWASGRFTDGRPWQEVGGSGRCVPSRVLLAPAACGHSGPCRPCTRPAPELRAAPAWPPPQPPRPRALHRVLSPAASPPSPGCWPPGSSCPCLALPTSLSVVPLMETSLTTGSVSHFQLGIRGPSQLVPAATSWGGFMSPFYSGGNTGPERLSYSPKVTSWLVIGLGSEPGPASALHPISLTAAMAQRAPCPQLPASGFLLCKIKGTHSNNPGVFICGQGRSLYLPPPPPPI